MYLTVIISSFPNFTYSTQFVAFIHDGIQVSLLTSATYCSFHYIHLQDIQTSNNCNKEVDLRLIALLYLVYHIDMVGIPNVIMSVFV